MRERARFGTITLMLIGTLILSVVVTVGGIQADLLRRTQAALASAGVAYYGLKFDGRDAVLGGFVPSSDQAERIVAIVGAVPGVRAVRDRLVVERVIASTPTLRRVALAELRLQRLGSMLVVSGRVSDTDAQNLVVAAEHIFGAGRVRSDLRIDNQLEPNDWMLNANALVRIMNALSDTGRLSVRGDQAILGGRVRGNAERRRIDELAASIPGLHWRFELFNARGDAAGGGDA